MTTKTWWEGMPDPVLMESVWERQMALSGLDAYERNRRDTASETAAGKKMIQKLLNVAEAAIKEAQKEVVAIKQGTLSRTAKGALVIIPADTLALVGLRALLDGAYSAVDQHTGANYQTLCKNVGKCIETELNFQTWIESSRGAAKEYAKANGLSSTPKSRAEFMIEESSKGLSYNSAFRIKRRWREAFEELSTYAWSNEELYYSGESVIFSIIEALEMPPQKNSNSTLGSTKVPCFERHVIFQKGKKVAHVRMTEAFREAFEMVEERVAAMQVTRKPMLVKPKRWTQDEE